MSNELAVNNELVLSDPQERPIRFSNSPTWRVKVPIEFADDEKYIMMSASSATNQKYQRAKVGTPRMMTDSNEVLFNADESADLILLASCIYPIDEETGEPSTHCVSLATVKSWSSAVTEELITRLKEISGLDAENNLTKLISQRS